MGETNSKARNLMVICVGLPRSGKSSWARGLGCPIVNPDSIRLALHGQPFAAEAEPFVWAIAEVMAKALFTAGNHTVVIDATNTTEKRRQVWEAIAQKCDASVSYRLFDTPPEECKRRARETGQGDLLPVIDRMAAAWDLTVPESWFPVLGAGNGGRQ